MKVLAFLQNQWFPERSVEGVRRIFWAYPERRNELIARFLFYRCRTGKVLRHIFGDDWCDGIIWENASPEIGSKPSDAYPADVEHMYRAIMLHKPSMVLAFGRIAGNGLLSVLRFCHELPVAQPSAFKFIVGPHPAARTADVLATLRKMREDLDTATAALKAAGVE